PKHSHPRSPTPSAKSSPTSASHLGTKQNVQTQALRLGLSTHLRNHALVRFNVVAQAEVHRLIERATLVGVEVADLDHVAGAYAVFFSS
ncbi:MAG: hypothetical protein K1X67_20815, partial [Fimbriimonadaceae bacterium]|nr:hypothetical protein [Fimbriimonadaceae bacterium]